MSLEDAIRRFDTSQQFILDLLILEVRAEMPCYRSRDLGRFHASDCWTGARAIFPHEPIENNRPNLCPSCAAREELKVPA